jgi:hypothetical protein
MTSTPRQSPNCWPDRPLARVSRAAGKPPGVVRYCAYAAAQADWQRRRFALSRGSASRLYAAYAFFRRTLRHRVKRLPSRPGMSMSSGLPDFTQAAYR